VKWKIPGWKSKNPVRAALTQPDFYKSYLFCECPELVQNLDWYDYDAKFYDPGLDYLLAQ
jgi:hypothetical protein